MTLTLYMDHNVVRAVTEGCRMNGLDVLTAFDDGCHQEGDRSILERAGESGRVIFTQDSDFLILAADHHACGMPFAGVIFAKHGALSVRKVIDDLTLICQTLSGEEIRNQLIWLPL
jgi:predicted nuclease of predicted toxin-antitoxin system